MNFGFKFKRRLYENAPAFLKKPVGWLPFSWLAGKHYRATMLRGRQLDMASRAELAAFQDRALKDILSYAANQVPAYHSLRATVDRMSPTEALKAFPLLKKEALQAEFERYLPRDFERIPHYLGTTGGTTGNQLRFFVDDQSHSIEQAFLHRQWARVGYTPKCRKATFRGVDTLQVRDGVYWQHNPIYNEMQFSPFHMNHNTLGLYLEQIAAFQPKFFHGYPSAIAILADFVSRQSVPFSLPSLRAILLGSEALYPRQRDVIEKTFSTRAYTWYGQSERVILGGECEKTNAYHHFPDYGYLEMVDALDQPIAEGETGEMVGTGFWNRALPLIRYRTGDFARKLPNACECGRHFDRFDQVQGRWKQEFVIGKNGSKISTAALNMHGPIFDQVVRYQYVQNQLGRLEIRVMATPQFGPEDALALKNAYEHKAANELDVQVTTVEDIPLTARGKLRLLVQEIKGVASGTSTSPDGAEQT